MTIGLIRCIPPPSLPPLSNFWTDCSGVNGSVTLGEWIDAKGKVSWGTEVTTENGCKTDIFRRKNRKCIRVSLFLKKTHAAVVSIHDNRHKQDSYVCLLCPVNHPYWGDCNIAIPTVNFGDESSIPHGWRLWPAVRTRGAWRASSYVFRIGGFDIVSGFLCKGQRTVGKGGWAPTWLVRERGWEGLGVCFDSPGS